MNKQFTNYKTTMYKYLKNTELIDKAYDSLSKGIPVPFEWAAKYKDEWTLHYSLIVGIDIPNNKIKIANPYGYFEEITIDEFINRTTFKSYDNMPLFLRFGFAFNSETIFLYIKYFRKWQKLFVQCFYAVGFLILQVLSVKKCEIGGQQAGQSGHHGHQIGTVGHIELAGRRTGLTCAAHPHPAVCLPTRDAQ